jgi:hypothetical protein
MSRIAISSFALALAASATIQPSFAQHSAMESAPGKLLECRSEMTYATISEGEHGQRSIPAGASVRIAFVNRSPQTATDITFLVDDQPITYQGRFSSNVPVKHTFGPYDTVNDNARCELYSVKFDDGRLWQRL